ncbi:MAG: sigma 54-interacting transcriptional regulator [Pseudomonadota bacterium]
MLGKHAPYLILAILVVALSIFTSRSQAHSPSSNLRTYIFNEPEPGEPQGTPNFRESTDAALKIDPAAWQTWWAYLGYALAISLFATIWVRSRSQQQAAINRHLKEAEVLHARWTEAQRIGRVANWEYDIQNDKLWVSDEAYRLLDVAPDDFDHNYQGFMERVNPDDRDGVCQIMLSIFDGRKSFEADHRIIGTNGVERVVHQRAEIEFDDNDKPIRIAGTVSDMTARRKDEDDIRRRASFQNLLAKLSADLIMAPPGKIEGHLNSCLAQIAERYQLDAIDIRWNGDDVWLNHWGCDDKNQELSVVNGDDFPWIFKRLLDRGLVNIEAVDNLPTTAAADRQALKNLDIKSLLAVPLVADKELEGLIVFSASKTQRDWCDDTEAELKLLAEHLSAGIARSQAVAEIKDLKDQLQAENIYLRDEVRMAYGFDEIVGEDPALKSCLRAVEKVAPTDVPVLILGETGTGKELIARAIHKLSPRRDGPMISVNCPALPENLIESELFGHEKGAFTDAHTQRKGRFELAKGGTLFLDELGELPLELQAKLLVVLQTGEFQRIGGTKTLRADARLIAATNRDLKQATRAGEFRADLFYRINTFPIALPPLRERKADIPLLAKYFIQRHAARYDKKIDTISSQVLRHFENHSWPGNVRELESTIERAVISTGNHSTIDVAGLHRYDTQSDVAESEHDNSSALASVERAHIVKVLEQTNWRISGSAGAATVLGVPSSTLRSKMKRYRITRP